MQIQNYNLIFIEIGVYSLQFKISILELYKYYPILLVPLRHFYNLIYTR